MRTRARFAFGLAVVAALLAGYLLVPRPARSCKETCSGGESYPVAGSIVLAAALACAVTGYVLRGRARREDAEWDSLAP